MPRFCLICDKPLSEYNRRPVCFCHEVEGQLSKKEIEELRIKKGINPGKEENMSERGTCSNCERPGMMLVKRDAGDLCGSCSRSIIRVSPGNHATVLAAAREKYRGKGKLTAGKKQKPVNQVKPFTVPCTIRVVLADGKVFMSVPGFIEIDGEQAA